jgi:predicted transposase YdaD
MTRKKDDILLKSAFEEFFPDLLRFFYPDEVKAFDFDRNIEFLDKELREITPETSKKGGNRYVDLLARCYLKNGREEWILVHIEIQGKNQQKFAERMFEYWYRIYDRYKVNVASLAVFTGSKKEALPSQFSKSYLRTHVAFEFPVYHIFDHTEEELLAMENPFSIVIVAAQKASMRGKVPEQELSGQRLILAKELINKGIYDHEKIIKFLTFLKNYIFIENKEINIQFDKQIEIITGKKDPMGIIETVKMLAEEEARKKGLKEGRKEGRKEGQEFGQEEKARKVVKNLLLMDKFSDKEIAQIAEVTEEFVLKVKAEL